MHQHQRWELLPGRCHSQGHSDSWPRHILQPLQPPLWKKKASIQKLIHNIKTIKVKSKWNPSETPFSSQAVSFLRANTWILFWGRNDTVPSEESLVTFPLDNPNGSKLNYHATGTGTDGQAGGAREKTVKSETAQKDDGTILVNNLFSTFSIICNKMLFLWVFLMHYGSVR